MWLIYILLLVLLIKAMNVLVLNLEASNVLYEFICSVNSLEYGTPVYNVDFLSFIHVLSRLVTVVCIKFCTIMPTVSKIFCSLYVQ